MRIGVISDIHADIESLEVVMRLLENADVDTVVCGGDLVERGSDGNAVVELLRGLSIPCVKGNHDENAIRHAKLSGDLDYEKRLSPDTLDYLNRLPPSYSFTVDDVGLMLTHAIPSDNGAAAFQDETNSKLSKKLKKDLARVESEILIVGHTHYPFDVTYREKWIVNPGCVCNLQSRDSHTFAVLDLSELNFSVFNASTGQPCEAFVAKFD